MVTIGKFSRVIKKDGTLLFKSYLKDSSFLENISRLYHSVFQTEFKISFIKQTSKGFHVRLKAVSSQKEALYLIGEEFSLPESEISGKSIDFVVGVSVFLESGKKIGEVTGFSETRDYYLIQIEGDTSLTLPFTEEFFKNQNEKLILIREDVLAI